jgi:small subunit ribosomal protein S2
MATTNIPSMQELLEAGVHFGHKVSRGHPKMKPYIYGARDGIHIIDLAKSEEMLKAAVEAAFEFGKEGKTMLIIGTKKQARELVEELAKESNSPFMSFKWVGGLFTNFPEVRKNIDRITTEKRQQDSGEVQRTKKEVLIFSRRFEKFQKELGGVVDMTKLPDAIFVVDAVSDNTAVKEALKMGIKIFGFSDTNADPNWFDFPVAANDDGIKSIKMITEAVLGAYNKGKKEAGVRVAKEEQDKKDLAEKEALAASELAAETEVLEELVEKKTVEDSSRKVA